MLTGSMFSAADAVAQNYIAFSSASDFTLQANQKGWDGTLYYSTDLETWTEWDGSQLNSADGKLYLRGTGNSKITGELANSWKLNDAEGIACTGNIENLLDHEKVANGEHPTMASGCYTYLFYNCKGLTTAPELPATTLKDNCYGGMFYNCTSLTTAPELPATTLGWWSYAQMFYNCTSLTTAPELPATTLAAYCYQYMFKGCTSLTTPPVLPSTTLKACCYQYMFRGCTSLKVSDEKTSEYGKPWRIPSVGSISAEDTNWNTDMLANTGGTFTGNPSINTTYYLYGTETGIAAAEAQPMALQLYPNPASSHVSVSGLSANGGTVQIFDVAGRLVLSVESNGEEAQTIDISGLAPGLHYVRSGSQTAKLMVK